MPRNRPRYLQRRKQQAASDTAALRTTHQCDQNCLRLNLCGSVRPNDPKNRGNSGGGRVGFNRAEPSEGTDPSPTLGCCGCGTRGGSGRCSGSCRRRCLKTWTSTDCLPGPTQWDSPVQAHAASPDSPAQHPHSPLTLHGGAVRAAYSPVQSDTLLNTRFSEARGRLKEAGFRPHRNCAQFTSWFNVLPRWCRQTDGQTDGHGHSIYLASIASRGENAKRRTLKLVA